MIRSLDSCWSKYHRGHLHHKALQAELNRIFYGEGGSAIDVGSEYEPDTPSYLFKVVRITDLAHTGLILGDALQNYRAALDFLVCRLVEHNGQPVTITTSWPAAKDTASWNTAKGKNLVGVDPAHIDVIEKYQPKEAGNKADMDPFRLLTQLSNKDKHEVITPVPMFAQGMSFGPATVYDCKWVRQDPLFDETQPLEPGTELLRVFISDVQPGHGMDVEGAINLIPAIPDGLPILSVLQRIRQRIVNVLGEFQHLL